jgi:uncharacterized membrane-anchored protein
MPRGLRNSENADVIESTLGVLHNITKTSKIYENNPTSGFMTSLRVTLTGHVTSGSHVSHVQWYILYYYYSKKKKTREKSGHAQKLYSVSIAAVAAYIPLSAAAVVYIPSISGGGVYPSVSGGGGERFSPH